MIKFIVGDYGQSPGLGLLRLHSTFRHDLKIYASDEGRVQMTAAAFAKVSVSFNQQNIVHLNYDFYGLRSLLHQKYASADEAEVLE